MPQERIPEAGENEVRALFGPMDVHLRAIRTRYGVRITARRGGLTLEGRDDQAVQDVARRIRRVLHQMKSARGTLADEKIVEALFDDGGEAVPPQGRDAGRRLENRAASRSARSPNRVQAGRPPKGPGPGKAGASPQPQTRNQEIYVEAIRRRDVVFSIGPAGTGKTYLAVAEAVAALRADAVRKIILTRPAVEAGEKLGFLPGDFQAKINPYLRPLYDALGELLPYGEVQRYIDADVIEIVPLAYMRGRTLKDAFIILDEAQNTTPMQMKMFLTRMGVGSKVVVTGDVTQVDLPEDTPSGLVQSLRILRGVPGIGSIEFGPEDIRRHPLVQRIVDAYERADRRRADAQAAADALLFDTGDPAPGAGPPRDVPESGGSDA